MVYLWAAICTVAACAVAVQGASLVERAGCDNNDPGHFKCETSGGSPLVSDCQHAIDQLPDGSCQQGNKYGSHCTTMTHYGTCKIDVCGSHLTYLNQAAHVSCKQYVQNLLGGCKSGDLVGGQVFPGDCHVVYKGDAIVDPTYTNWNHYRLQFSHS
ncbi:hypothetical protein C8Q80DRAFT_1123527 [Daedaleopsis nitida]|nr:hypothetical protein C8Q80DRAFT_1123527 [Daedaleopsis nitida]